MDYSLEIYRLNVVDQVFELIDVIDTFQDLTYVSRLDGIGPAQFKLSIQDPKASSSNLIRYRNQVAIKRNGSVVWFGPIVDIDIDYTGIIGNIIVSCNDYLSHFSTRFTDKLQSFVEEEQTEIAWDVINTTQNRQNGTLLVNQGSTATGVLRSLTAEREETATFLSTLAQRINGFDFMFNPVVVDSRVESVDFDVYYPYKGNLLTTIVPFTVGLGGNVQSIKAKTVSDLRNAGIAEGSGTGDTLESVLDYGSLQQSYTRREVVLSEKDVSTPSELTSRLEAYLNPQSVEQLILDITLYPGKTPTFDDIALGDILNANIQLFDYLNYVGQVRILEISVNVDQQGTETVNPKLLVLS